MPMKAEGPKEGFVVWMTGLPASGKSTLSRLLENELRERHGRRVEVHDGDEASVRKLIEGLGRLAKLWGLPRSDSCFRSSATSPGPSPEPGARICFPYSKTG